MCMHSHDVTLLSKTVLSSSFCIVKYQTCLILKTSCRGQIVFDESCNVYVSTPLLVKGFLPHEMVFKKTENGTV